MSKLSQLAGPSHIALLSSFDVVGAAHPGDEKHLPQDGRIVTQAEYPEAFTALGHRPQVAPSMLTREWAVPEGIAGAHIQYSYAMSYREPGSTGFHAAVIYYPQDTPSSITLALIKSVGAYGSGLSVTSTSLENTNTALVLGPGNTALAFIQSLSPQVVRYFNGTAWSVCASPFVQAGSAYVRYGDCSPTMIALGTTSGSQAAPYSVAVSTNGGSSWANWGNPTGNTNNSIISLAVLGSVVWACVNSSGVYWSTNGTWNLLNSTGSGVYRASDTVWAYAGSYAGQGYYAHISAPSTARAITFSLPTGTLTNVGSSNPAVGLNTVDGKITAYVVTDSASASVRRLYQCDVGSTTLTDAGAGASGSEGVGASAGRLMVKSGNFYLGEGFRYGLTGAQISVLLSAGFSQIRGVGLWDGRFVVFSETGIYSFAAPYDTSTHFQLPGARTLGRAAVATGMSRLIRVKP